MGHPSLPPTPGFHLNPSKGSLLYIHGREMDVCPTCQVDRGASDYSVPTLVRAVRDEATEVLARLCKSED